MNFVQELKASVLAATGLKLHYGNENELNITMDYGEYPCAYGIAVDGSTIVQEGGLFKEQIAIVVAFVDLAHSENSEEIEAKITERKEDALNWLAYLKKSDKFDLVQITQAGRLYNNFDAIVCGYSVNVTLKELDGRCAKVITHENPVTATQTEE